MPKFVYVLLDLLIPISELLYLKDKDMSWLSRLFYGRIGNISSSELLSSKNEAVENLESNPPSTGDIGLRSELWKFCFVSVL